MRSHRLPMTRDRVVPALLLLLAAGLGAPAADFPQGLMLHFSFDPMEAGGAISDRSGRNNNGRAFGALWTSAGKQAGAYEFTPTNSYIEVNNSSSLNPTQATWAVWFKTSNSTDRTILEKMADGGYALGIAGETGDKDAPAKGKLRASVNGHACLSDSAVTDGLWHHGAATFDGENLKLYVDGQLQKQVTPWRGAIASNACNLTLGMNRSSPAPSKKDRAFDGTLDDLMIFNHALSEAEIKVVMASIKPQFGKGEVKRRLTMLKDLYNRGLLTQEFYDRKVKECETEQ